MVAPTPEEDFVLNEIKEDYKYFNHQTLILSLIIKIAILTKSATYILDSLIPAQFKVLSILGVSYMCSIASIKHYLLCPRYVYHLKLMQVGREYQLGRDVCELVDLINHHNGQPSETTSKPLRTLINNSLITLLQYNRDLLVDEPSQNDF
jgi:hypothetical protein